MCFVLWHLGIKIKTTTRLQNAADVRLRTYCPNDWCHCVGHACFCIFLTSLLLLLKFLEKPSATLRRSGHPYQGKAVSSSCDTQFTLTGSSLPPARAQRHAPESHWSSSSTAQGHGSPLFKIISTATNHYLQSAKKSFI